MLVLNILAIFVCFSKIVTSIVSKKIKDGILLVYMSDIFTDVKSLIIFIDIGYIIMVIFLLFIGRIYVILGNNFTSFGQILFAF